MAAKIPVFVSAPSVLSEEQARSYEYVRSVLEDEGLEPRALGRTDYGVDYPLKEVYSIATHCAGGVILGFSQMTAPTLTVKAGTPQETQRGISLFPSPWNNLEAGILFALQKPLMVFRQAGVEGGVFDNGVTEVFVQYLPADEPSVYEAEVLRTVIKTWAARVRTLY